MDLEEKDIAWRDEVLGFYDELQQNLADVANNRDDFCKAIIHIAIYENGGHAGLARLFHDMFPDRYVYLITDDEWFEFDAPRWWRKGKNTDSILGLLNRDFKARIDQVVESLLQEDDPPETVIKMIRKVLTNLSKSYFK